MNITCLGSGSSGNSYIINQEDITYLLDAGVDIRKIIANVNLNELEFAFISHEHKDHSQCLESLVKRGVNIVEGRVIQDFTKIALNSLKSTKYKVFCFPVKHGECKNAGIIVKTENECLLYITDFSICKYDLSGFNFTTIMVECNYDDEKMSRAERTYKHLRQINTHMGFNGLKTFIKRCVNLDSVNELILIHLSTESELIDREILSMKAKLEFKKKIGICKQRGGIEWYGG